MVTSALPSKAERLLYVVFLPVGLHLPPRGARLWPVGSVLFISRQLHFTSSHWSQPESSQGDKNSPEGPPAPGRSRSRGCDSGTGSRSSRRLGRRGSGSAPRGTPGTRSGTGVRSSRSGPGRPPCALRAPVVRPISLFQSQCSMQIMGQKDMDMGSSRAPQKR